jgi:hypothetical protein
MVFGLKVEVLQSKQTSFCNLIRSTTICILIWGIYFVGFTMLMHTGTPSVQKYKMFWFYKANVSRYLLVYRFERIYTKRCLDTFAS